MVATAPGEKRLMGRRSMRNWTQLQFFLCFTVNSEQLFIDAIDVNVMVCGRQ